MNFSRVLSRTTPAATSFRASRQSWTVDPTGTIYDFQLRPDAKWSNGDKVTPDDFVFAFRRLMAPSDRRPLCQYPLYFEERGTDQQRRTCPPKPWVSRALDEHILEITLERPAPYFISQLAHFTAKPLHRRSVETYSSDFVRPAHMVTNGPFMLKYFTPNDRLVLIKNPYYYDAAHVALDEEIFYSLEDRAAALRRFMAGEIQSYDDVPVEQIGFVRSHLAEAFKVTPNLGSYFYAFDTRHKPFDDKRVRQALSMVIDREFLAERIWGGTMDPGYSFVPPGIESYGAPATVAWKDTDLFEREDDAKSAARRGGLRSWRPDTRSGDPLQHLGKSPRDGGRDRRYVEGAWCRDAAFCDRRHESLRFLAGKASVRCRAIRAGSPIIPTRKIFSFFVRATIRR